MVQKERIVEEFCNLVSIDSVSFHEREMADVLKEKLTALGATVEEDKAGDSCGGNAGNVYAFLKGTLPGEPLLFSAHMDTVVPGIGKKAVRKADGRIESDGNTVLGADDLGGIVAILEALTVIKERKIPHRDIEILFPVAEEVYAKGSSIFDYSKIQSKEAYTMDLSGKVGYASLQEPTIISFTITVNGKASHAGFAPEEGVNAIAIASNAISGIEQGRVGEDTTVNLGCIKGGSARNIVSELVTIDGEIRSYSHEKALKQLEIIKNTFKQAIDSYNESHCNQEGVKAACNIADRIEIVAYKVDESEPVVKRFLSVCEQLGYEGNLTKTFGGSDNNCFIRNGIRGIVLACAMNQVHSTKEYTEEDELVKISNIVLNLMLSE
jgi:tripeptide aminopeptidase